MKPQRLMQMLEDIVANQAALPRDEALETVVVHLQRFWAPPMRTRILAWHLADGTGLSTLADAALTQLRAREQAGEPAPPTRRGASDAG
ncbi:MAG: formate dehydrogenase subunit delta [Pseudoxanthomonas suwonensis]|nr:formate dehydrogenase subunit delta [Pseudoxanthomonas suwonensis]